MTLKIHALHVGTLLGLSKAAVTFQRGYFERIDVPVIMFVITGGEHTIVVDTGISDAESALARHGITVARPEDQDPRTALESIGVDPADVGTVVNTHLHWDHCANNYLFPDAQVIVQKTELEYAVDPFEPNLKVYERRSGITPDWMRSLGRVRSVAGDVELEPGISLVHLPGHSPGSQGVLVHAAGGDYLVAGDCVSCYENWTGDALARHIPAAFTDLGAYMKSFRKIEALGCEVIPSHDQRVLDHRVFS
ncbi:MBL fold metallo-hydrolase [Nocardioides sp. Root1257]|uniref:N-acyl homoserine lactonase family protein n=1 Tax=unclassified Nocardioides TaxID=2615069 RepID=UPI0006F3078F|nr:MULTISPECIES: N-acyl homoserine lactonase family protein [unclassified Nocardioides]KQW42687.1 MBL fold metallo-hydrolase [Nocardioides sp. Root1257]KRC39945.1 MBL fold metallo-hydrolase [Nocardioides sp. Root224]